MGSCSTVPGGTVKRGKLYFTGAMYNCKRGRKWNKEASNREMSKPDVASPGREQEARTDSPDSDKLQMKLYFAETLILHA